MEIKTLVLKLEAGITRCSFTLHFFSCCFYFLLVDPLHSPPSFLLPRPLCYCSRLNVLEVHLKACTHCWSQKLESIFSNSKSTHAHKDEQLPLWWFLTHKVQTMSLLQLVNIWLFNMSVQITSIMHFPESVVHFYFSQSPTARGFLRLILRVLKSKSDKQNTERFLITLLYLVVCIILPVDLLTGNSDVISVCFMSVFSSCTGSCGGFKPRPLH